MKILSIEREDDATLKFVCLIYGKEYTAFAFNVDHMIEKILFKDKHATKEDILLDIKLNFSNEKNTDPLSTPDSESECTGDAKAA